MHQRKVIRKAITAALDGETVAGSNVFSTQKLLYVQDDLPAIAVYAENESSTWDQTAPRELDRKPIFIVESIVDAGENVDDAMDDMAEEIEKVMDTDPFFKVVGVASAYFGGKTDLFVQSAGALGEHIDGRLHFFRSMGVLDGDLAEHFERFEQVLALLLLLDGRRQDLIGSRSHDFDRLRDMTALGALHVSRTLDLLTQLTHALDAPGDLRTGVVLFPGTLTQLLGDLPHLHHREIDTLQTVRLLPGGHDDVFCRAVRMAGALGHGVQHFSGFER